MKVIFAVLVLLIAASASSASQRTDIQCVAWLQGCWELVSPSSTVEEQWMAPRGKSVAGVSRTVRAGSLVAFEMMVIREQGDDVVFEAYPSGQPAAVFHLVSVRDSAVVFENLDHDFPQRIGYRLSSPDSLLAWIEGTQNGKEGRREFSYSRAVCAGN